MLSRLRFRFLTCVTETKIHSLRHFMSVAPSDSSQRTCGRLLWGGDLFQNRARRFTWARIVVHAEILLVAMLEGFHLLPTPFAGILILALAIASIVLLTLARRAHTSFRLFRVNLLLSNSLGLDGHDLDNQALLVHHHIGPDDSSPRIAGYYRSRLLPGTPRLKSNLAETLFFAKNLWHHSSTRLTGVVIIPSLFFLSVALAAPFLQSDSILSMDRIVILIVAFLSEVHLVTERFELAEAQSKCELLFNRLQRADTDENVDLVQILCAYSAIAFAVPPPFQSVYDRHREDLTAIWEVESRHFE